MAVSTPEAKAGSVPWHRPLTLSRLQRLSINLEITACPSARSSPGASARFPWPEQSPVRRSRLRWYGGVGCAMRQRLFEFCRFAQES